MTVTRSIPMPAAMSAEPLLAETGSFRVVKNATTRTRSIPTGVPMRARIGTPVGIDLVRVVAFFTTLNDPVSARSGSADIAAGIGIDLVTVIAFFTRLNHSVSATCDSA